MFGVVRCVVFAVLTVFAIQANAANVVKIYSAEITLFQDHKGKKFLKKWKRKAVSLPAAVTSNVSPSGFIQVKIVPLAAPGKPVIGWVRKRSVKLDKRKSIDINCQKSDRREKTVTRGRRGLGEGC